MVYGFAKQSGGHATIESEPGAGTRVTLFLPVASQRAAAETAAPAEPAGKERVLVVEDDPMVRIRVEELLAGLGYRVTAVADADAALAALGSGAAFDLLFTDIVMPGALNGTQLAQEARRLYPSLRILFTSGYADDALDGDPAFAHGALLLKKPYRRSELAARVREALGKG
jgi:CheY-like chemotaxis protein